MKEREEEIAVGEGCEKEREEEGRAGVRVRFQVMFTIG
jgi:hypothetical protein